MKIPASRPFALVLALAACSAEPAPEAGAGGAAAEPAAGAQSEVDKLRAAIAELQARPEHDAPQVRVQHLLVSFAGDPGIAGVTRTKEEAERLTAELLQRIEAGQDFDALVVEYTNDSPPGIYPMTQASRRGMVPGFGNVGWRLEVGQFGVAGYDPAASPYGWHIIKRLE